MSRKAKKEVTNSHALDIAADHRRRAVGGEELTQTEKALVVVVFGFVPPPRPDIPWLKKAPCSECRGTGTTVTGGHDGDDPPTEWPCSKGCPKA